MNDESEIIKLSCERCKKVYEGTFTDLFGDIHSLIGLPKIKCKCGGVIILEMTGVYG